jgi:hypothetical protein
MTDQSEKPAVPASVKKFLKQIASSGGKATVKKYGREHMRWLSKKGVKARREKQNDQ